MPKNFERGNGGNGGLFIYMLCIFSYFMGYVRAVKV